MSFERPRLLADVGGTFARFAVEQEPGVFAHAQSLRCADHPDFHAAVRTYLDGLPGALRPPAWKSASPMLAWPSPTRWKATKSG